MKTSINLHMLPNTWVLDTIQTKLMCEELNFYIYIFSLVYLKAMPSENSQLRLFPSRLWKKVWGSLKHLSQGSQAMTANPLAVIEQLLLNTSSFSLQNPRGKKKKIRKSHIYFGTLIVKLFYSPQNMVHNDLIAFKLLFVRISI